MVGAHDEPSARQLDGLAQWVEQLEIEPFQRLNHAAGVAPVSGLIGGAHVHDHPLFSCRDCGRGCSCLGAQVGVCVSRGAWGADGMGTEETPAARGGTERAYQRGALGEPAGGCRTVIPHAQSQAEHLSVGGPRGAEKQQAVPAEAACSGSEARGDVARL